MFDAVGGMYEEMRVLQQFCNNWLQNDKPKTSAKRDNASALASIREFTSVISKTSCYPKLFQHRLSRMAANAVPYRHTSQSLQPSGWSNTPLVVYGMVRIDLECEKTMIDVVALCKAAKLAPPHGFIRANAFHYGRYVDGQLVTMLSLSVMKLNNAPGAIAVSIDLAASIDPHHSMSIAIDAVKKIMRTRRSQCVLFAQVLNRKKARVFWQGKLTATKRASVMTVLFSQFDDRYLIYEDTSDMALFYDN